MINPYIYPGIPNTVFIASDNAKVIKQVTTYFAIDIDSINGTCRYPHIVKARHFLWLFLNTHNSLKQCGKMTGGKDHTTVRDALIKLRNYIEVHKEYQAIYSDLCGIIGLRPATNVNRTKAL